MDIKELLDYLGKEIPANYACSWDNCGLQVGHAGKEVKRVYIALDATEQVVCDAAMKHCDFILTHHPLLFSPVKKINTGDFIGRRLIAMIQADLCYYAMHTNFDVKGMAELNSCCLGLQNPRVLEETAEGEGIGRTGELEQEMSLLDFAEKVKHDFGIPDVRVYGDPNQMIKTVSVSSGSGKSMVSSALMQKADVLVTGDIDYHTGIDAKAQGLAVIDAGHYGTEYGFIAYMKQELGKMFPDRQIGTAEICQPYQIL